MTKHIMVDLETMGTQSNAAILSIGAIRFNPTTGSIGDEFYRRVAIESSLQHGSISPATVKWWLGQSDEARQEITEPSDPRDHLLPVIEDLADWWPKGQCTIWGNGPTFDVTILEHAFRRAEIKTPWRFWEVRCFRTIKQLGEEFDVWYDRTDIDGTEHNALDDAQHQAKHVCRVYEQLRQTPRKVKRGF